MAVTIRTRFNRLQKTVEADEMRNKVTAAAAVSSEDQRQRERSSRNPVTSLSVIVLSDRRG